MSGDHFWSIFEAFWEHLGGSQPGGLREHFWTILGDSPFPYSVGDPRRHNPWWPPGGAPGDPLGAPGSPGAPGAPGGSRGPPGPPGGSWGPHPSALRVSSQRVFTLWLQPLAKPVWVYTPLAPLGLSPYA